MFPYVIAVLAALAILIAVVLIRTFRFSKKDTPPLPPVDVEDRVRYQEVADKLCGAIRCATVSNVNPDLVDWSEFQKLHEYLEGAFPLVHKTMEKEKLVGYNLVYRWKGVDQNRNPIAFLSHQDVVPVTNESKWKYPPFSGTDDGEFVWGRGALDMKQQMIIVLEACERLIASGFTPEEDVYLCFGQNEEVGCMPEGTGADMIAKTLKERGIRFDCVLDEGGAIINGKSLGINQRLCMVGVAEKGFATYRLTAKSKGGHASTPPRHTALGKVCRAATRLESNPKKPRLAEPAKTTFCKVMPYFHSFLLRMMCANLWLFKGLFLKLISRSSQLRAMTMTTFAVTQASGSEQDNILPQSPWIAVNSRVMPDENIEQTKAYIERVIDDKDVEVSLYKGHQVHDVSNIESNAMSTIDAIVNRYYPGTLTSPHLQMGGSDARNYYQICENVYRFMPIYLEKNAAEYGAHRDNEHCPKEVLGRGVAIVMDFIKEYKGEKTK